MTSTKKFTTGQQIVLGTAAAVMVAVGIAGAVGTFSNTLAEFGRKATAAGVVAAGEGLTLILALTMLGLTLLGQSAPLWVRAGLWLAPLTACGTGLSLADTLTEAVVYAVTPLGMSGAAEGLGLIARRIVIYTTGVDAEAQRRNAHAVQQLAYHQAAAERHPDKETREEALRKSWKLGRKVGVGDHVLGAALVDVQRQRIVGGADTALAGMYGGVTPAAAKETAGKSRPASAIQALRAHFADMDPADAIRLAHDARPDAPPAELAVLLGSYGVAVDPVAVALVLGQRPPEYEVHRPDAADAPLVNALEPLTVEGAVVEAASALGPDASAREIAEHVARTRRLVVTEPYVRTALSRATKRQQDGDQTKPMEGGYA
ncbi:conjugal transfer protein [Streptomyces werraensis]|uniref:conjugal transfer protein n=1 Tax=Streptomyces werraensis TaxID=68284 RepID=UPI003432E990